MFFMTQRVAQSMVTRQRGRVINIGSVTSVFGYAGLGPYCASRGGVKQLTMSMADELGPHGITVNCLLLAGFGRLRTMCFIRTKNGLSTSLIGFHCGGRAKRKI